VGFWSGAALAAPVLFEQASDGPAPGCRGQPEASGAGIAVTHLGVVGFSGGGGESDDLDGRRACGFGGRLLAVGRRLRRAGVEQVAVAEVRTRSKRGARGASSRAQTTVRSR
jgi:hypothetical protein